MTDKNDGYFQETADLRAENERLEARYQGAHIQWQGRCEELAAENAELRAEVDRLREVLRLKERDLFERGAENAKLRAELAMLRESYAGTATARAAAESQVAELRKQAEAAAAAPTDAEIEAWRETTKRWDVPSLVIADAVALMRRAARSASAPSALVAAAKMAHHALHSAGILCDAVPTRLQLHKEGSIARIGKLVNEDGLYRLVRDATEALRAALAAEPEQPDGNALEAMRQLLESAQMERDELNECVAECREIVGAKSEDVRNDLRSLVDELTALKAQQPGVVVPEDVRKWAERAVARSRRLGDGDEGCCKDIGDWILSLPAASGAAPQAAAQGCEVRRGSERVCEEGTQDCIVLHTPLPGSDEELQRLLTDIEAEFCDVPQSFDEVFDVLLSMRDMLRVLARKVTR